MSELDRHENLREQHRRLRAVCRALLEDCRPAGGEQPMCAIPPHRIRKLRRELQGELQPSGFATMSIT